MPETLIVRTPLRVTFVAVLVLAAVWGVISNLQAVGNEPGRPEPADFNVFHLVAGLALSGRLDQAYGVSTMAPLERALTGHDIYIPWSYPPLFGLMLAPLAMLPLWLAQGLFVSGSLAFYLGVTRRLCGPQVWPVWMALVPCLVLNLQSGQNGLLTGGLAGLAALCLIGRRPVGAGAAVAALAAKPHLAVMLPVVLALERRWPALILAAFGALLLTGLSIAVLGWSVFDAFLRSAGEVQQFMAAGVYPMPRMTSVYALLLSFGMRPGPALAVHAGVALVVLTAVARIALAGDDRRISVGLAIAATIFVSPYIYDYDLTFLGVGLALISPALAERMSARQQGLLLAAVAISLAVGLGSMRLGLDRSLSAVLLLPLFGILLHVLNRPPAHAEGSGRPATLQVSAS